MEATAAHLVDRVFPHVPVRQFVLTAAVAAMDESQKTSGPRRAGPALEAAYQIPFWLILCVDRFPRARKFTSGERYRQRGKPLPLGGAVRDARLRFRTPIAASDHA